MGSFSPRETETWGRNRDQVPRRDNLTLPAPISGPPRGPWVPVRVGVGVKSEAGCVRKGSLGTTGVECDRSGPEVVDLGRDREERIRERHRGRDRQRQGPRRRERWRGNRRDREGLWGETE